ncbi:MAG: Nitroreductase [uncultured Thiotrichaceae bacterium]|uniref:Nitroreductase n=1 Tax=uncultured Thiotrichaceae bacterium TaxID=298394 RepID=A0A6S6SBA7_9GAMM|nr:MAG: Nitroreductase [uncultured Thiotrichaceae bacterium]
MNDTIRLLQFHTSIRNFKADPIEDDIVKTIISAAQCTASSNFVQACTVIRVRNQDTRNKMAELAGNQPYVTSAPVFLMFCADLHRAEVCCDMHEKEMLSGFTEQFIIATTDVALMAQTAVVAAESLGLGICYIGGIRNHPAEYTELLELPEHVYPVFGLCLGYPDQSPETKPRLPVDIVLKEETYGNKDEKEAIAEYDDLMREYYKNRSSNIKQMGWSEQMAELLGKESRPHMKAFLESQGFKMR